MTGLLRLSLLALRLAGRCHRVAVAICGAVAVAVLALGAVHPALGSERIALEIGIEGVIGPAVADHVGRGLKEAVARNAAVVLLTVDTPGGLDTSMREIVRAIMASPVPVIAYVTPGGARAASAGTYILYASHVAAMAPATNIGAATPVAIGGGLPGLGRPPASGEGRDGTDGKDRDGGKDRHGAGRKGDRPSGEEAAGSASEKGGDAAPGNERDGRKESPTTAAPATPANASEAKALNDAVAWLRSLAEYRDRNADWAERAVRESASLSASAARAQGVVDIVADDVDDLFRQAAGRTVRVGAATATVDTTGLTRVAFVPDWRTRVLGVVTNPNIALLLVMLGVYGLLFEFMTPGSFAPGTIGAICLLVGLYALSALPLDYAAAALAALGLILIVSEAFVPSFGILGLGGAVALAIGLAMLVDVEGVPGYALQWPVVAGVIAAAIGLTVIIARAAWRSTRYRVVSGREAMIGAAAEVVDWGGSQGHVRIHGERWRATAGRPVAPGDRVRVVGLDGLVLAIEPGPDASRDRHAPPPEAA
ncbi:MAG: nodulation protein NfeD [Burkholderiaceae bacterium]